MDRLHRVEPHERISLAVNIGKRARSKQPGCRWRTRRKKCALSWAKTMSSMVPHFVRTQSCFLKELTMLPAFFHNIAYYKIDDRFSFSGDLIITPGIIYYFPHTDLEQERIYRGGESESGFLGLQTLGD